MCGTAPDPESHGVSGDVGQTKVADNSAILVHESNLESKSVKAEFENTLSVPPFQGRTGELILVVEEEQGQRGNAGQGHHQHCQDQPWR